MAGRWGQTGARAEEDRGEEGIRLISAPALHDEALVIAEFMGPLARHRGAAAFSSQEQSRPRSAPAAQRSLYGVSFLRTEMGRVTRQCVAYVTVGIMAQLQNICRPKAPALSSLWKP